MYEQKYDIDALNYDLDNIVKKIPTYTDFELNMIIFGLEKDILDQKKDNENYQNSRQIVLEQNVLDMFYEEDTDREERMINAFWENMWP